MKKLAKITALALFLFTVSVRAVAEPTSIENLHRYTLKNGLELYVAENHTVPLAYIEICFKAGAITQSKENAGLFHLYEHMLFKGNSKYKSAEAMQNAMTALGVTSYNGTTSNEYINYFFTIPAAELKNGLEFWSYAVRKPLLNKRELEAEKKVVVSEVENYYSNPGWVANYSEMADFFAEAPWKTDPCGSVANLQNATVQQLKEIQSAYYIPNNAALFVGGDVKPDEVYKLVEQIYGDWKRGADPWEGDKAQFNTAPFEQPLLRVMPLDTVSPQIAQISVDYRGPDAEFDRQDTYAIDMLLKLADSPSSAYRQKILQLGLGVPGSDYIGFGYATQRRLGVISNTVIVLAPEQKEPLYQQLPLRALLFAQEVPNIIKAQIPDGSPSAKAEMELVFRTTRNGYIYDQQTADGLLSNARFWWACTDIDYFCTYLENLAKVTPEQMGEFVEKYIATKMPRVVVYLNPLVYQNLKEEFAAAGFSEITAEEVLAGR